MTDQKQPWEPGRRPVVMPTEDSRGPSYDAEVERTQAAFAAVRPVLAGRPILDSVGDLAALVATLPPEIAVVVDDQVRIAQDATPDAGGELVFAVVAEMATMTMEPKTPVRDLDGQEYDVLEPALQLGTRVLTSPQAPAQADTRVFGLHGLAEEALEAGEIGAYLTLVARQLQQVATHLDTTIAEWLPRDQDAPELAIDAGRLRAVAESLAGQAPTIDAMINDEDNDPT
ncbi:hypothetical protein [Amycolatopsis sp. cmx-4-61]|uniref:hypothetical protein n=1 Tax=Amycolatopsis sp. cmx-4-61 TaxID=2790937 RepID=UPI00397B479E